MFVAGFDIPLVEILLALGIIIIIILIEVIVVLSLLVYYKRRETGRTPEKEVILMRARLHELRENARKLPEKKTKR